MRTIPPALGWAALASLAVAVAALALVPRGQVPPPAAVPKPAVPAVEGEWAAYVAPVTVCPGGDDAAAPVGEQEQTMLCLVNFARARRGLSPVLAVPALVRSSDFKAADIAGCRRFDHDPCGSGSGRVFEIAAYGAGASAYATGENLAIVSAEIASPRHVFHGWLKSTGHRENLFRPEWTEQGVALLPRVTVEGYPGVNVWVSQLGYRRG